MIRQRTDASVANSAQQIDAALAAGLTSEQVVALVVARNAWHVLGDIDPTTINNDLLDAVQQPAALEWDAIFVRRARAELSALLPSVRS